MTTRKGYKKKKYTVRKKFNKLKCAPIREDRMDINLKDLTCYSSGELAELKELWNKSNPNNKISSNNSKEIWLFLKNTLNNKCYNELCWLKDKSFDSKINKQQLVKEIFRPFSPKTWKNKPYEWLSSVDIIKVMKQYEKKYVNFSFIGPSPIDFDNKKLFGTCVWESLCKFDLNNYYNNSPQKNKIGIAFNLDPHYKSGSHWVALFIDLNKNFIFYFDSNGEKIPSEINKLVKRIKSQATNLNIKLKFYSNKDIQHQQKDGQCGVYILYFIIELLTEKKDITYFRKNRIPDELMKNYRKKYYNAKN